MARLKLDNTHIPKYNSILLNINDGRIMDTIGKAEFKDNCLAMMRAVESTGEAIIITDRNRPVLELRRYQSESISDKLGETVKSFDTKPFLGED
jgi:hypothetical protein